MSLLALVLVGTGVAGRPDAAVPPTVLDLWLHALVYAGAALACVCAGHRSTAGRGAWYALAVALVLDLTGGVVHTSATAGAATEPFPSVADGFHLASYLPLSLSLVALIRARVDRFHASMWLDGVVGALGAGAVSVAVCFGSTPEFPDGDLAAAATRLAYPLADVVLVALLVAAAAILGVRRDPVLLLLGAGVAANLVGDVVHLGLVTRGVPVEGGPLDLIWLVGAALVALAAATGAAGGRGAPATPDGCAATTRVGWRVLAVPLTCNLAGLLVLAAGYGDRSSPAAGWLAVGCVLAALARTLVTFREVRTYSEVRAEARTDELTGLPNRRALLEQAREVVGSATTRRPAALLLLDLDGFKEVNDSLGHHAGDELLRQVGRRLGADLPSGCLLARLGGDEFAVLLREAGPDEAAALAGRLHRLLLGPFAVEGIRLHVGVSIGVAIAPVPATTVQELLRCADVAMYTAKASREGVHVHVPDPDGGTGDRLRTMDELRTALDEDQLEIHLQPQVALQDGQWVGVEALVRWRHPSRGLLSPAQLLPAAEQAGLLRALTDTVLELALAAAARWWPQRAVPVSVNLSAANVTDLDLPDKVALALLRHGLPPAALTLELVEDTLMADPERGRAVLGRLRARGIRTSLDDYGTGHSSLAYLRGLPADELKLDRTLTRDVAGDPRAAAVVRHTVALAHDLGLALVAEGVEDVGTAAVLAGLGCDAVQGYAVARPMPVEDFLRWTARPLRPLLDPVP